MFETWYVTWAAAATIVAAIEFAVAFRYMYKYEKLRSLYVEYRYGRRFSKNPIGEAFHGTPDEQSNSDRN